MSKKILVRVKGGLGNQLFQYAMWMRLKEAFPDAELALEVARLSKGKRSLALLRFFPDTPLARITWFQARMAKYAHLLNLSLLNRMGLHPKWIQESEGVDFDEVCRAIAQSKDCLVDGYWQTTEIHAPVLQELRTILNARHPAIALPEEMQHMAKTSIAVHIRLDDYLLPENQLLFAQLNTEYFIRGIELLHREEEVCQLVIFSDAPGLVLNMHPALSRYKLIMASEHCSDYIEEFLWLKDFERVVISNSTFSYWASSLQLPNPNQRRIFPKRYFQLEARNQSYLAGDTFHLSDEVQLV